MPTSEVTTNRMFVRVKYPDSGMEDSIFSCPMILGYTVAKTVKRLNTIAAKKRIKAVYYPATEEEYKTYCAFGK